MAQGKRVRLLYSIGYGERGRIPPGSEGVVVSVYTSPNPKCGSIVQVDWLGHGKYSTAPTSLLVLDED